MIYACLVCGSEPPRRRAWQVDHTPRYACQTHVASFRPLYGGRRTRVLGPRVVDEILATFRAAGV